MMSAAPKFDTLTIEEYLALDRASRDTKYEYLHGEIVAMAEASLEHNLINVSTSGELYAQLKGRLCSVMSNDMRLRVAWDAYVYPDIIVVCGEPQIDDSKQDILLNPTVIVEVLSPSTEAYDRGEKGNLYRALDTLQEYLLISQHKMWVEQYVRMTDGGWRIMDYSGEDAVLHLKSIECTLALRDMYRKVTFDVPSTSAPHHNHDS